MEEISTIGPILNLIFRYTMLMIQIAFFFKAIRRLPEFISKGQYGIANGIFIVQGALDLQIAILAGIWVIFQILNKKIQMPNKAPKSNHESAPGSSSDYERWKAEREKEEHADQ